MAEFSNLLNPDWTVIWPCDIYLYPNMFHSFHRNFVLTMIQNCRFRLQLFTMAHATLSS